MAAPRDRSYRMTALRGGIGIHDRSHLTDASDMIGGVESTNKAVRPAPATALSSRSSQTSSSAVLAKEDFPRSVPARSALSPNRHARRLTLPPTRLRNGWRNRIAPPYTAPTRTRAMMRRASGFAEGIAFEMFPNGHSRALTLAPRSTAR